MKRTVTRPKPRDLTAIFDESVAEYEHFEERFRQLYVQEANLKYARFCAFKAAGFKEEQAMALLLA